MYPCFECDLSHAVRHRILDLEKRTFNSLQFKDPIFHSLSMVSPDRKPELEDWRVGWGSWKLEKLVEVERQVLSGCRCKGMQM